MLYPHSHFDIADQTRADLAELIDLQMSPLGLEAMDALDLHEGQVVLDVGCGSGQTVLQLAKRVGSGGRVIGVDIAPRVLSVAYTRTQYLSHVSLVQEDAACLPWPDECFDAVYSRFGVMFFPKPEPAFKNLRRVLRSDGRLSFVCWRKIHENELDLAPLCAAGFSVDEAPHTSFADPAVIEKVLKEAGFVRIAVNPHDADVSCGDIEATLEVVTRVGALGKILRETPSLHTSVEPKVRAMLEERMVAGQISLKAATWIVSASRS